MRSSFTELARRITLGIVATAACATVAFADDSDGGRRNLDRVFVIMMENHGFDQVVGALQPGANAEQPNAPLLTPFITQLALTQGLQTFYFGVTHPSLPNYLATIAGDFFGVQDDNDSCFAMPVNPPLPCHHFNVTTLVDQLESHNISWEGLMESAPNAGFLGDRYPAAPAQKLYAQKHNPFVYFDNIALNVSRLAKIKPFVLSDFKAELANPSAMPRFVYIVPNQCNDQHGTGGTIPPGSADCSTDPLTVAAGDSFLQNVVTAITSSPSFTRNSAIFIVWDENDFSGQLSCCVPPSPTGVGGGHATAIVVTKQGQPRKSAKPTDHYSLLATIEEGFDLPRLRNAAHANTLWDLFPSDSDSSQASAQ